MSIRSKIGRFGALIAALLLAASVLVLPSSTQPVQAANACTPPNPNLLPFWQVRYNDNGVILCEGWNSDPDGKNVMLQIVDLSAGAKVRLVSDAVNPTAPPSANNQYHKRTAEDWFSWIQGNVISPPGSRVFSTTNGSFFKDTSSSTTELSFPEMSMQRFSPCPIPPHSACSIQHFTKGWTYDNHSHPDWDAPKGVIDFGDPTVTPQNVSIGSFATHYDDFDIAAAFDLLGPGSSAWYDGTVAFLPTFGSGAARRTFVGVDGWPTSTKVWILATDSPTYTVGQAQDILDSFGSVYELQLDGGGSTQFYSEHGEFPSLGWPVLEREVPDVLAVFEAP